LTGKLFTLFLKIIFNPVSLKIFSQSLSDLKEVLVGLPKKLSKKIPWSWQINFDKISSGKSS